MKPAAQREAALFQAAAQLTGSAHTGVVQGAVGEIVAAAGYDLYRLRFMLSGAPLFRVFPRFSELLLDRMEPRSLVHGLGWRRI